MCPECNEPMVVFELDGVEVDRCLQCEGVWLDAGEIDWIADLAGARQGRLSEILLGAKGPRAGKRRCPRCRQKLRAARMPGEASVEIDRCPRGDGLWFDRGELEAFLTAFDTEEEGAVARFFRNFRGESVDWVAGKNTL